MVSHSEIGVVQKDVDTVVVAIDWVDLADERLDHGVVGVDCRGIRAHDVQADAIEVLKTQLDVALHRFNGLPCDAE